MPFSSRASAAAPDTHLRASEHAKTAKYADYDRNFMFYVMDLGAPSQRDPMTRSRRSRRRQRRRPVRDSIGSASTGLFGCSGAWRLPYGADDRVAGDARASTTPRRAPTPGGMGGCDVMFAGG